MKQVFLIICLFILKAGLFAQSFSLDPSFQVPFNFKTNVGQRGRISHVLESSINGKLILNGNFLLRVNNQNYPYIRIFRNGTFDPSCTGSNTLANGGDLIPISNNNNNYIMVASSGNYLVFDTTGLVNNVPWRQNYRKTVSCSEGFRPYFYSDGSSLMGNFRGNFSTSCRIINPPDTFPHRYIIKVDPNGLWDSSFVKDANEVPRGFIPYDNNRILVYGLPRLLTQYDGRTINGLCRIFLDGTLDTTFQHPVFDTLDGSSFLPIRIHSRDETFLIGNFYLKGDTAKQRYIVRLKENGQVDSSFAFSNATHATSWWKGMGSVAPTPDGGYLVAGAFDHYQGHAKNALVKLDSNGIVEPQYFTNTGPDSSALLGLGFPIVEVKESKFGGYYVFGDFTRWDGQPTQPILRLRDLITGVESSSLKLRSLKLYPNPSNGTVNISNSENIRTIRIYNLQGQLIKNLVMLSTSASSVESGVEAKTSQFELPKQTGMYIIQIEDEEGNVISKKSVRN